MDKQRISERSQYDPKKVLKYPLSHTLIPFQMQYTIHVTNAETDVLTTVLSISKVGLVPTQPGSFSVQLKCSGIKSAEIEVLINIQLQNGRNNVTEVVIKRRKTCLKS